MAPILSFRVKTSYDVMVDVSGRDGCATRAPDVASSPVVLEEVARIISMEEVVAAAKVSMTDKGSDTRLIGTKVLLMG